MVIPVPVEAAAAAVVVAPVPVLAAFPFLAVLVAPAAAVLETTPLPPALIWPFKICYSKKLDNIPSHHGVIIELDKREHTWNGTVLIVAATTTPFPFMVCLTRFAMLTLKIVEQPKEGTVDC